MPSKLSRAIRPGAVLAVLALTVITAPAALAAAPVRAVIYGGPIFIPAGQGCAFDVTETPHPGAHARVTDFADGRTVWNAHGNATFRNEDTGVTFEHRARFLSTERYDPETNDILGATDGQVFMNFWPGDQGPYGVVGSSGAIYRFTGRLEYRFDLDTFMLTSFASTGRVVDICAALS